MKIGITAVLLAVVAMRGAFASSTDAEVIPAIQKVLNMLNNLVTTLTQEGQEDEEKFGHFTKWVNTQKAETSQRISDLQTKIEDTQATLTSLRAQKGELDTAVMKLKSDVAAVTSQINVATDKRNEEHESYVIEQTNFDNAIAACGKAVEILGKHYGDGSEPAAAEKPQFMSLLQPYFATIRAAANRLGKHGALPKAVALLQKKKGFLAFVQQPGPGGKANFERYEASTGEALSIVDQVKVLTSTFAEDKASSAEEEARLQKLYTELMTEKQAVLNDLVAELAEKTKVLNQVNQDIASNEGELAMMQKNLADAQEYLKNITEQFEMFSEAFQHRKKDRNDEMQAVQQALGVLAKYNTGFVQIHAVTKAGLDSKAVAASVAKSHLGPQANKAIAFLHQKAAVFHSALLEAAATASAGLDALDDIIRNLEGLIGRIDEEQKSETHHKEWCEKETGLTTKKRDDHRYVCDDIRAILANLVEVVAEKKDDIGINRGDKGNEDTSFAERDALRTDEKKEFEIDLEEHREAIQALNEAIDILAKYYASRDAAKLIQLDQPGGKGSTVVNMLSETRHEFEQAKNNLEKDEDEAVTEFSENKAIHLQTDADLDHQKDTLTVEQQTAEGQIDQEQDDLEQNTQDAASAQDYLDRLGKSCYPLIARYDKRKELRAEEKGAIQDAIKVLREEA